MKSWVLLLTLFVLTEASATTGDEDREEYDFADVDPGGGGDSEESKLLPQASSLQAALRLVRSADGVKPAEGTPRENQDGTDSQEVVLTVALDPGPLKQVVVAPKPAFRESAAGEERNTHPGQAGIGPVVAIAISAAAFIFLANWLRNR